MGTFLSGCFTGSFITFVVMCMCFFLNRDKPVSRGTLNGWSKRIGEMIGVPTLHPHDFRHSGATLLKNAGMSLEDVSVLLSHESTDTTKKYYIKQDTAKIGSAKALFNI